VSADATPPSGRLRRQALVGVLVARRASVACEPHSLHRDRNVFRRCEPAQARQTLEAGRYPRRIAVMSRHAASQRHDLPPSRRRCSSAVRSRLQADVLAEVCALDPQAAGDRAVRDLTAPRGSRSTTTSRDRQLSANGSRGDPPRRDRGRRRLVRDSSATDARPDEHDVHLHGRRRSVLPSGSTTRPPERGRDRLALVVGWSSSQRRRRELDREPRPRENHARLTYDAVAAR
jgi:hypothetical protein